MMIHKDYKHKGYVQKITNKIIKHLRNSNEYNSIKIEVLIKHRCYNNMLLNSLIKMGLLFNNKYGIIYMRDGFI